MAFGMVAHGNGRYGSVERVDDSHVVTVFKHVWFLPIFPRKSMVEASTQTIPIRMHLVSVLVAYLRTWGVVWLLLSLVAYGQDARDFLIPFMPPGAAALFFAVLIAGSWMPGRLSATLVAQRRVYAKYAGAPVDVSRLWRGPRVDLRERLDAVLATEGRGLTSVYRDGHDPRASYHELALHPSASSVAYLEAALTCARLELGSAKRRERPALLAAHDAIWKKLIRSAAP